MALLIMLASLLPYSVDLWNSTNELSPIGSAQASYSEANPHAKSLGWKLIMELEEVDSEDDRLSKSAPLKHRGYSQLCSCTHERLESIRSYTALERSEVDLHDLSIVQPRYILFHNLKVPAAV